MGRYCSIMLCALGGSLATWCLNTQLDLGPVVASGLVGLLAALVLPSEQAVATYTASFVGMSSPAALSAVPMVLMAGGLMGMIFILALPVYQGFGGKLGTIAACAVLLTMFVFDLFC